MGQTKNGQKFGSIVKTPQKSSLQGGLQKSAFQATPSHQNLVAGPSLPVDCSQASNSSGDALGTQVEQAKDEHILGPIGQVGNVQSLHGASSQETSHSNPNHQNLQDPSLHPEDSLQLLNTQNGQRVPPVKGAANSLPIGQGGPDQFQQEAPQNEALAVHPRAPNLSAGSTMPKDCVQHSNSEIMQRVQPVKDTSRILPIEQPAPLGPAAGASLGETLHCLTSHQNLEPPPPGSPDPLQPQGRSKLSRVPPTKEVLKSCPSGNNQTKNPMDPPPHRPLPQVKEMLSTPQEQARGRTSGRSTQETRRSRSFNTIDLHMGADGEYSLQLTGGRSRSPPSGDDHSVRTLDASLSDYSHVDRSESPILRNPSGSHAGAQLTPLFPICQGAMFP